MSFARKQVAAAQEKVRSLLRRLSADPGEAEALGADIFAEIEDRKQGYGADDAQKNKYGRIAGASDEARERRLRMAKARQANVRDERQKRASRTQAEHERVRQRAAQANRARQNARTRTQSTSGTGSGRRQVPRSQQSKIEEHYKTLELPVGADFTEVKKSFRRLMRKYHPDRHTGNPKKEKAATELSMRVSQAYKALEDHLKG